MADNWSNDYDTRYGVDPSDYESEGKRQKFCVGGTFC